MKRSVPGVFSLGARAALWGAMIALVAVLQASVVQAQEPDLKETEVPGKLTVNPGEKEVRLDERRLRFVVQKAWNFQKNADWLYIASSEDRKMVMFLALLDKIEDVPEVMGQFDGIYPVRDAKFGEPRNGLHRGIPTEILSGAGKLGEVQVEMSVLTMRVASKPVLAVFYVHKDSFDAHFPAVKRTMDSFTLILTKSEARKLQKKLKTKAN